MGARVSGVGLSLVAMNPVEVDEQQKRKEQGHGAQAYRNVKGLQRESSQIRGTPKS